MKTIAPPAPPPPRGDAGDFCGATSAGNKSNISSKTLIKWHLTGIQATVIAFNDRSGPHVADPPHGGFKEQQIGHSRGKRIFRDTVEIGYPVLVAAGIKNLRAATYEMRFVPNERRHNFRLHGMAARVPCFRERPLERRGGPHARREEGAPA